MSMMCSTEIWKPVPIEGIDGRFEASSTGRIRSLVTGRVLSLGSVKNGYRSFVAWKNDKSKQVAVRVHKAVALAFLGPVPEGKQINHIDGDKGNNALLNLEYVTPSENRKHAYRIGLDSQKGMRHHIAVLTDEDVYTIRARADAGEKQATIGADFGIGQAHVSHIKARRLWPHLPERSLV